MLCPECSHDNRAAASFCENCGLELSRPAAGVSGDPSVSRLASEPLSALSPNDPVFVAPETSVAHAVDTMNRLNIGCVLVGAQDRVAGIFTERDLLFGIGEKYEEAKARPVADFMTRNPEMLDADTPLLAALNQMAAGGFRHIPVTQAGRLVGIVSLRDLLGLVSKWYPDLIG